MLIQNGKYCWCRGQLGVGEGIICHGGGKKLLSLQRLLENHVIIIITSTHYTSYNNGCYSSYATSCGCYRI